MHCLQKNGVSFFVLHVLQNMANAFTEEIMLSVQKLCKLFLCSSDLASLVLDLLASGLLEQHVRYRIIKVYMC